MNNGMCIQEVRGFMHIRMVPETECKTNVTE